MPDSTGDVHDQVSESWLDYGCSPWKTSSQRAAEIHDSGAQLWRKEDLVDIEQQLAQSFTAEKFTIRRIDGSHIHIKNPMFGVQKPIWKPQVQFQEYWYLVNNRPDGPQETYNCTYLLNWDNQTIRNYEGPFENTKLMFESTKRLWDASMSCTDFKSQFGGLLVRDGNVRKITKIVCFGLGDMDFKPSDTWRLQNKSMPKDEQETETSFVEASFIHHAIALTMADVIRSYAKTKDLGIRILTQDPAYSNNSKDLLQEIGFDIVGEFGAGGFAELDDESVVFSPFTKAPVKQIIADFARPVAIICNGGTEVFNSKQKPYADPESPRTRQMWKEYTSLDFPLPSEGVKLEGSLHQLKVYDRVGE